MMEGREERKWRWYGGIGGGARSELEMDRIGFGVERKGK